MNEIIIIIIDIHITESCSSYLLLPLDYLGNELQSCVKRTNKTKLKTWTANKRKNWIKNIVTGIKKMTQDYRNKEDDAG